ncbi:hypothetical protein SAMN04488103_10443 [Gemmobacter aquatilis]|uniref:Uncharacterized protein n=1 Tax=Gemmobacter aquatilis TaxID=933059 RepID=A0A1H8F299_9RHOB|nr:hypothetical protein SAMN04488103_10443 [Gemmobacter aquatilis]
MVSRNPLAIWQSSAHSARGAAFAFASGTRLRQTLQVIAHVPAPVRDGQKCAPSPLSTLASFRGGRIFSCAQQRGTTRRQGFAETRRSRGIAFSLPANAIDSAHITSPNGGRATCVSTPFSPLQHSALWSLAAPRAAMASLECSIPKAAVPSPAPSSVLQPLMPWMKMPSPAPRLAGWWAAHPAAFRACLPAIDLTAAQAAGFAITRTTGAASPGGFFRSAHDCARGPACRPGKEAECSRRS